MDCSHFSFKTVCRVCLEDGANLSLFNQEEDSKVYLKIMACSTIQISEVDGYPSKICDICYSMLNTAFEFKQKCESSDLKLRTCYSKDVLKMEEVDYNDYDYENNDFFSEAENVKECDEDDEEKEVKPFDGEDVKVEAAVPLKKKLSRKKKKWKVSDDLPLALCKRKKDKQLPDGRFRKCTTNNIATSLLEGKCSWNGTQWRFDSIPDTPHEEKKSKLEIITKLKQEEKEAYERRDKARQERRKLKKSVDKPKTINLCDTCGQTFKSKYHLKYHIMLKHQECTGTIKCQDPSCKKLFKLDHYMMRHVKRCHSTKREFVCTECGKQYAFISSLKQHMKSHSENMVWKMCNFCPKKYRTQKSVDIHVRSVHTGERPSVCTLCDSAFFHDDYLKEHMRLHTGETPYKCPVCKRGYAQRGNMKSHMKQHRISELDEVTRATMKPNYLKLLRNP